MSESKPRRFALTLRDLFWLTGLIAILIAGLVERARLIENYEWILRYERDKRVKAEEERSGKRAIDKKFEPFFKNGPLRY